MCAKLTWKLETETMQTTLDHTGQILDLVSYVDRLAEKCELDRVTAWDHPEPPFDGDWMEIDDAE